MSLIADRSDLMVGASTGSLKAVRLKDGSVQNLRPISGLKPAEQGLDCLCWADEAETEVLCAQLDRQLCLRDAQNEWKPLFRCEAGDGPVRGLDRVDEDKVLVAVESGLLRVYDLEAMVHGELEAGADLCRARSSLQKSEWLASGGKENPLKVWDWNSPQKPLFAAKNVAPDWLQL